MISIIMAYHNRKDQTLATFRKFNDLYSLKYNFEVIIVDDMSNNDNLLDNFINNFNFKIKLIKLSNKTWINPVVPYNVAIMNIDSNSKYVIIQNPEIYHCSRKYW